MPERVARLVYVAGIMLPSGGTFLDVIRTLLPTIPAADGIAPHLVWSEDRLTSRVTEAGAIATFFNDCTAEDAAWAAARLTPQPERGRAVSPTLTAERFGSVPRVYIEAALDRSVIPPAQALMQSMTPGARRIPIDAGHVPQLSRPAELAAMIDAACAEG
jgi:pimeloyl-ACP methyl ester carboxylesterase